MQRTINHTGRRKIKRKEIRIHVHDDAGDVPSFDAEFNLDTATLPDHAAVYVEAYHKNTLKRFQFGTVTKIEPPPTRTLDGLDRTGPILFSVRVVDERTHIGRLIASVEQLKPETDNEEEERSSLITLRSRPLGQETWRVNIQKGNKPELSINSRIPDAVGQLKHNPLFQSLILPAVLRHVLMFFLWDDNDTEDDPIADEWFRFAEHFATERPPGADTAQLLGWVDTVITQFSDHFQLCQMLLGKLEQDSAA
jgi:hypothetical protein